MERKEDIIMTSKLARIHAHLCGDGSVFMHKTSAKDRNYIAVIGYYNKNQKLLDKFRQDFSKLFGVKMKMRKNREVSIRSIKRYKFFVNNFGNFGSREWRIPRIIKKADNAIKLEWLKAFFEDEAYHERKYNRLKIKSVNYLGLKDVKGILDSINIPSTLTGPNCDFSYYLTIPNFSSFEEFSNFVKEPIRK